MNIIRGDKVILMQEVENLKQVGEAFEVANVLDNAVVLRDVKSKVAIGSIDIAMFDQYFKKPEEVKGWTPWQHLLDASGFTVAFYRSNLKQGKVQVRTADNVRSEASCHRDDVFNLRFGIDMAYTRCKIKALSKLKADYETSLSAISNDLSTYESKVDRMIKSLNGEAKEE